MADGFFFERDDIAQRRFDEAMGVFAASVCVIAAEHEGLRSAVTASAAAVLSILPRGILVSIEQSGPTLMALIQSRRFSVNILGAGQGDNEAICAALNDPISTFDGDWRTGPYDVPYLYGAQANIFCDLMGHTVAAGNGVVVGGVFHAAAVDKPTPLVRFANAARLKPVR
jgi:flavin reductase (DIM6/NTAB) family NADH-FMN oxidoreductase RutF